MSQKYEYIIEEQYAGTRLDKYISEQLEDISRSYIQKLSDEGAVLLIQGMDSSDSSSASGKVLKASYKLRKGDRISITLPDPKSLDIVAEDIELDIVYEDNDVIIINKPQGMVVHPAAGNYTGTLVNALMYHYRESLSSINGIERPGIVHRIDKDTSGLLLVCKNDKAHQSLAKQFEEHTINRIYSCVVMNHFDPEKMLNPDIKDDRILSAYAAVSDNINELSYQDSSTFYTITVDKPINRGKTDRKRMVIDPSGRRAVTHIYLKDNIKESFAYIKCKLETGRTHQIRVHLSSIGHPLLGDPVYGAKKCPFNLQGQALHAGTLGFIHPSTGEYMEFTSELPDYFKKLIN